MRLILGVFVCLYAGSLADAVLYYWQSSLRVGPVGFHLLAMVSAGCLGGSLASLRQALTMENLVRRLAIVLGLLYAGLVTGIFVEKQAHPADLSVAQMVVHTLCAYGLGLVLAGFFLREHRVTWADAFGLATRPGWALACGLVAAAAFLPVGRLIEEGMNWFLTHLAPAALKPKEQNVVTILRAAATWRERGVLAVVTIVLAPVAEEVFFRGILYSAVRQAGFPRLAFWGTAALFALVHLNLLTFVPLLALALALTLLYERTGNLLASIAAHSAFNAANFAMLYFF